MSLKFQTILIIFLFFIVFISTPVYAGKIMIGFNLPITGWNKEVGESAKNAAELVNKDLQAAGGLKVGSKFYDVKFLYGDNESSRSKATVLAIEQITKDQILGMIGPLSSQHAVPTGQLVNSFATPMISPWSASPLTTLNRPYVFRSGYILDLQGGILTKFAASEFRATKATVLYDIVSSYPRASAKNFKAEFEKVNGEGSIVSYKKFRTGDIDFRSQLNRIKATDAQIIFSPQHSNEVPLIINKQRKSV